MKNMNKRQKFQVALIVLFAVLLIIWLFLMVLSYRAEEKNKNK